MVTLFEKICNREIPANIIYEDEYCVCFHDTSPQAPVHLLLIPRKPIPRIALATEEDQMLLGYLMLMIGKIAKQEQLDQKGFRIVMNNGEDAGEAVPHLHIHILAGRKLNWPPG
jgi:histidine triad (HIT) family protein